jgi:RHS repeat-associated protein
LTKTNSVGSAVTSYQYDVRGSLLSVDLPDGTAIEYVVDAYGRRVGKKVNGTLVRGWLYKDALKIAAETDGNGALVSQFVYAKDTPSGHSPEFMLKGGAIYRLVKDQVGSIRLVVNAFTGAVAQELTYDAFGQVLSDSAPGFQPFGFAGGLYDADTGLVRFGARDYDAETGRWTSKDPIGFEGGQGNLYEYSRSDPINEIDPAGLATAAECVTRTAKAASACAFAAWTCRRMNKGRCSVALEDCWRQFEKATDCLDSGPKGPEPGPDTGCRGTSSSTRDENAGGRSAW